MGVAETEKTYLTKNALKCWYLRWLLAFVFLLALELGTVRLATNILYGVTLAAVKSFALSIPVAFGVALVLVPYLRFKSFSYSVGGGRLVIFSGALAKKKLSLPFEHVQHIGLRAYPFERFYKLVTVKLYTAGSEHVLPSITLDDAKRLQLAIYGEQYDTP